MNAIARQLALTLVLAHAPCALGQQSSPSVTEAELLRHITVLASDEFEGRKPGAPGGEKAAAYIAQEFERYGLLPLGEHGSYFQPLSFVAEVRLGQRNTLSAVRGKVQSTFDLDRDVRPLGFSASSKVSGDLVFAGYGIILREASYDDYATVDVKGKIVMVLRSSPDDDNPHSAFGPQANLRSKISRAKDVGAAAVILVTGPAEDEDDVLMKLSYDHAFGDAGIPVVHVTRKAADNLLRTSGTTVAHVQDSINRAKRPFSFPVPDISLTLVTDLVRIRKTTSNVVGMVRGSDPALRDEVVVVGAHYDHLGYGGPGSGSLKPDTAAIHNGADDNASGTAGLLELAQAFAATTGDVKRSVVFVAFSAEEMGLLGSAHFVSHPPYPLEKTVTMVNMDMIGRLTNRKLIVYGTGTSPGFDSLLLRLNSDSTFVLRLNKDGFGPSDHSSFYAKKIPVFHFFTDLHSDYHRPEDDTERINAAGTEAVVNFVRNVVLNLARRPDPPVYAAVETSRPMGETRGFRVFVGTIPDYGEEVAGMKLAGVRDGSPAAKGGLQAGDIMVRFGKVEVKNIYDYTFALSEYKPGDEVEVVVMRKEQRLTCTVRLEKRN